MATLSLGEITAAIAWGRLIDPSHRLARLAPGDYSREARDLSTHLTPGAVTMALDAIDFPDGLIPSYVDRIPAFAGDGNDRTLALMLLRLFDEGPRAGKLPYPSDDAPASVAALWPLLFTLRLPVSRDVFRKRNLPMDLWKETWTDLALWDEVYHGRTGRHGLREVNWLAHHARGEIFRFGRLQYLMDRWDGPAVSAGGETIETGRDTWSMHIPAGGGLTPEACGESHRQALEAIERHFPDRKDCPFTCVSWILSPDLEICDEGADNLVDFQNRFYRFDVPGATADQMWERVFGGRPAPGVVPQLKSRLQKSIWRLVTESFPSPGPKVPGKPFATGGGLIPPGENPWL